jgi:hypothetical protein
MELSKKNPIGPEIAAVGVEFIEGVRGIVNWRL